MRMLLYLGTLPQVLKDIIKLQIWFVCLSLERGQVLDIFTKS